MGEEGCGSRNPTCSLFKLVTIMLKRETLFWPLKNGSEELYKCWEENEWRRGKVNGSWVLRMQKNRFSTAPPSLFPPTC